FATRNIQSPFWMDTTLSSGSELARGASTSNDIGVDLLRILNAYASEHPVVLIFEDLHRASKQSLELLELIARHNPGPLLLICEFRPLEAAVDLRELIKNLATSARMLRLEPFTIE